MSVLFLGDKTGVTGLHC